MSRPPEIEREIQLSRNSELEWVKKRALEASRNRELEYFGELIGKLSNHPKIYLKIDRLAEAEALTMVVHQIRCESTTDAMRIHAACLRLCSILNELEMP